jgi:hypothetical protein
MLVDARSNRVQLGATEMQLKRNWMQMQSSGKQRVRQAQVVVKIRISRAHGVLPNLGLAKPLGWWRRWNGQFAKDYRRGLVVAKLIVCSVRGERE